MGSDDEESGYNRAIVEIFEQYLYRATKHLDDRENWGDYFICEVLSHGSHGGSWREEDKTRRFWVEDYLKEPVEFKQIEALLRDIVPEARKGAMLEEILLLVEKDDEGRASEPDCYGNFSHYDVFHIGHYMAAKVLCGGLMREPKEWIARLLRSERKELRLLGASIGTIWQREMSLKKKKVETNRSGRGQKRAE